jgi:hypothetical protein
MINSSHGTEWPVLSYLPASFTDVDECGRLPHRLLGAFFMAACGFNRSHNLKRVDSETQLLEGQAVEFLTFLAPTWSSRHQLEHKDNSSNYTTIGMIPSDFRHWRTESTLEASLLISSDSSSGGEVK